MTKLYGYRSSYNEIKVIDYEAMVVRKAFKLYNQGYTEYEIAKIFEERGYLNKSGKVIWTYAGLRDMLTNEKYIGDTVGPKTYSKDILSGRRYENDSFNKYYAEGTHIPIITKDIFDKAQQIRENTKTNGVRKRKTETALSRKWL